MAIQLPGTPQQQKADFSAFDTSSSFQSGLTKVGQALQQIGAGQARIKQREEQEIERKEKAGQRLLSMEAEEQYSVALNEANTAYENALNVGDLTAIKEAEKQMSALDPNGANFDINKYAPQNRRSDLTDEEYSRRATLNMSKEHRRLNSALKTKRVNADTFQRTVEFTKGESVSAMLFVNDNEEGVPHENLASKVDEIILNPKSQAIREATGIGEPRAIFDSSRKNNILNVILNQFENTAPLSEDEVKSRMEGVRDILRDSRYRDAGVVFDADDEEKITKAYNEKLKVVSDKPYQKEAATQSLSDVGNSLALVMDASVVEQGDMSKLQGRLAEIDPTVLSPANQQKYKSLAQFSNLFVSEDPEETPFAYLLLDHMAKQPEGEGLTVADVMKGVFADEFSNITLAPTHVTALNEWVGRSLKLLRDVGETPTNIRVLSPELNEVVKKAQSGDKEAWLLAENAYKDFVENSPDLKSEAPPMFYVTQVELPTEMGNEDTYVKGATTNVVANGPLNTISHAAHRLAQGDVSKSDLLRYKVEMAAAEAVLRSGAATIAQQEPAATAAALEIVALYKSGGEPSRQVDDLVEIIKAEDNKFDRDESGNVIPILALVKTFQDTLDPSQEEYYDQLFRGAIKLNLEALLKKDDPEEQHELIRDLFFKKRDVLPLVAASESGSLVEIPQELNHYIDESKDRTGFFGRSFQGFGRMFDDKESKKTVASIYAGAAFAEFLDQFPSLNVEKTFRDIEGLVRAELGDDLEASPSYVVFPGAGPVTGFDDPSEEVRQKRTYRAMLRKMMNTKVGEKPVLKLVTEVHKDEEGNPQKVVVMKILNSRLKYKALPISETDQRPIAVPVSKLIPVVDKVMPSVTGIADDSMFGDVPIFNRYFVTQLFGMEEGVLYDRAYEAHDKMYGETTEVTQED